MAPTPQFRTYLAVCILRNGTVPEKVRILTPLPPQTGPLHKNVQGLRSKGRPERGGPLE